MVETEGWIFDQNDSEKRKPLELISITRCCDASDTNGGPSSSSRKRFARFLRNSEEFFGCASYMLVTTREFGTIDILGLDNVAIVFLTMF